MMKKGTYTHARVCVALFAACLLAMANTSEAAINFSAAQRISCGTTIQDNNNSGPDDENIYNGFLIPTYTAPERVYQFTLSQPSDISISARGEFGLVMFLLNAPAANAVAGGVTGGNPMILQNLLPTSQTYQNAPAGTYYIVIDGTLGATGDFEFTLNCAAFDCLGAIPISCNQRVSGNTATSVNKGQTYNCLQGLNTAQGGKDLIYRFNVINTADVVIEFTNVTVSAGGNPFAGGNVMLLRSCDTSDCIATTPIFATVPLVLPSWTLNVPQLPGGQYFIVVDSPSGVDIGFDMEVKCVRFDCSNALQIPCGSTVFVDNQGRPNETTDYSCTNLFNWAGGESIYRVVTTQPGDIYIDIKNVNVGGGLLDQLGVFLLDACSINSCIAYTAVPNGDSGVLSTGSVPPGTYYIVIDTTNAGGGSAELDVFCGTSGTPQLVDIEGINRKLFPEVEVRTKVSDRRGQFISGLTAADFAVKEDTVPQSVSVEELECGTGVQVSIALVIDTSASMDGQAIADARNAAVQLVNALAPNDRAAVISFDTSVAVVQPFTDNKTLLRNEINGLTAPGSSTSVYDGIYRGIDELRSETNARAVFVLTDGSDNNSSRTPADCIRHANANAVTVYTIGLGSSVSSTELRNIANNTGGTYSQAPSSSDLQQIYNNLYRNLKAYYLLRYTTTNPVADGTTRDVQVCVGQPCDSEQYDAQPNCLVVGNYRNPEPVSSYEVAPSNAIGQRFFNAFFSGTPGSGGFVNDLEVEIFFENATTGEVSLSWWTDNPGSGTIGSKVADSDEGSVVIECPGWYGFKFQNAAPNISLVPGRYYWLVLEHSGQDPSPVRYNLTGPQGGVAERSNGSWGPVNENNDIFFRVFTCVDNVAPPTATPTSTPTPQGTPTATPMPTCQPIPPQVTAINPLPQSVDVPQFTEISITLSDQPGVDRNSLQLTVDGQPQTNLVFSGPDTDLTISWQPTQRYAVDSRIPIRWEFCDKCPQPNCGKGLIYGLTFSDTAPTYTPTPTPSGATPTATPTGAATPTPGGSPTATPTPSAEKPLMALAGYGFSNISASAGGALDISAFVQFGASSILEGELYFEGQPLGLVLPVVDVSGSYAVISYSLPLGPVGAPFQGTLQMDALNSGNMRSDLWPYLNVGN